MLQTLGVPIEQDAPVENGNSIDSLRFIQLLLDGKRLIVGVGLALALVTALVVFTVVPVTYTAQAVFLPPSSSSSFNSALLSQLSSSLGAVGGGLAALKNPGDLYVGILASRSIGDEIVNQFNLQAVYNKKRHVDALKKLQGNSTFLAGKDTLVTISVSDHDAKRAADIANAYLDALQKLNGRLALTDASQRRLFLEEQLQNEKNLLAQAEVDLKRTQETTGIIEPRGQTELELRAMSDIRAQIVSLQITLASLHNSSTDQNPEVVRVKTQIAGLEQQLRQMETATSSSKPGNVQVSTSQVPTAVLEYVRKQREVKYHETLFEALGRQYEAARLDELHSPPLLQVVDHAVPPERKSGPPRMLLILAAGVSGCILAACWLILQDYWRALSVDPLYASRQARLRASLFRL